MYWLKHLNPMMNVMACNLWEGGRFTPNIRAYDHKFIYVHSGHCQIRIADQDYVCHDNTFLIIPPASPHSIHITSPCRRTIVHFDWKARKQGLQPPYNITEGQEFDAKQVQTAPRTAPIQSIRVQAGCSRMATQLHWMFEDFYDTKLSHRCQALWQSVLVHVFPDSAQSVSQTGLALAERIADALGQRPFVDISMAERLSSVDGSQEHLTRVFKQYYGITPLQYVTALRIETAKQRLQAGESTIADIAMELGFSSPAYFAHIFRRTVGMTPSNFKKLV